MGYSFGDVRILAAEDNAFYAELLRLMLRAWGARTFAVASGGIDAFQRFKANPFDIVITDYAMEPLSGVELLRLIRTSAESRDRFVPVILISGYTEREHIEAARDAGATEIMAKPVTPKDLAGRLESIIERPRPFIEAGEFFGPDRRRHADASYRGAERRVTPPDLIDLAHAAR